MGFEPALHLAEALADNVRKHVTLCVYNSDDLHPLAQVHCPAGGWPIQSNFKIIKPGMLRQQYPFDLREQCFFMTDPGSEFFHPGSASKNLSILTLKIVSKLSDI
jgi:hypothetical protein